MINEKLTFGIDLGIGSCGWAVLQHPSAYGDVGKIVSLGSWCFDVPETSKERTPTNQVRRGNRLLRRVIRRRRQRMAEIRHLFHTTGLLSSNDRDVLKRPGLNPWELRARGLDEPLTPIEFSLALGHIAKRRGFKSAAKRKVENSSGDDKKMLAALNKTKERLARYRTVGEMFARDPDFTFRRRNRNGLFDRTCDREDLIHEVSRLFAAQRRLGQNFASPELEGDFKTTAFRQLPMQDSERLVGSCPFEPDEKRSAKLAPSYERFRLLTRLINLRIKTVNGERPLTSEELAKVTADIGKTAKLSARQVRKLINLAKNESFTNIKQEDEDRDIVARTGEAMPGTAALRKSFGETLWATMRHHAEQLDAIAHVLSFFETNKTIVQKLGDMGLEPEVDNALREGLGSGSFSRFKGAGHISAKACRTLLPHLEKGYRYDKACQLAGYNHAASSLTYRDQILNKTQFNELVKDMGENIANPIARKALTEGLKQLWAMRNCYGLPGAIHIELARDVGNSLEKRRELENQLDKITAQRKRERTEVQGLLNLTEVNGDTLLRYRLWKEQGGKCFYSGNNINIKQVVAADNSVQVDHILPWSRFADDSFNNKTLSLADENQRKKGRTPHEWFQREKSPEEWQTFVQRIETNKELRGFKKRNFLLKNAEDAEKKFRNRNLNDTRYATRLIAEAAKLLYPAGERQEKDGKRRIFTRPGALTAALRHAWGLESLKKVNGKRVRDDRHHALDALTVAAVHEGEIQRLTKSFQEWEQQGLGRLLRYVEQPWPGFRADVLKAYEKIFVVRPERRRARGEGHKATIRQVKKRDNSLVVFERRAVTEIKQSVVEAQKKKKIYQYQIKDPERNKKIDDEIKRWVNDGCPTDMPPRSPHGDVISKVRLESRDKPAIFVRGGTAGRGEIVRVDVFTKPNKRGKDEWYLVPIYPHQVMNKKVWPKPPDRSVVANKDEKEWTQINTEHKFCFSLYPRSYVEVTKKTGEVISGYFSAFNRATGAIDLASANNPANSTKGIGAKTLLKIKKYNVDRFGTRSEIKGEIRTWHGEACTSLKRPD